MKLAVLLFALAACEGEVAIEGANDGGRPMPPTITDAAPGSDRDLPPPTTPREQEPYPPAPPCPEGSIDLGAMTRAEDVTTLSLGFVEATGESATFEDRQHALSAPIELCFPADAQTFVLATDASAAYIHAFDRGDEALIDASTSDAYQNASPAVPYRSERIASLQYPALPDQRGGFASGPFRVVLGFEQSASSSELLLTLRRGRLSPRSVLRVNVAVVEGALEGAGDRAALEEAAAALDQIYRATSGIDVEVRYARVDDPSLLVVAGVDADFRAFERQMVGATGDALFDGAALTVYVVRDLTTDDGPYYGVASGIPGYVGYPLEGVIVGLAIHRDAQGTIDGPLLGSTMGHEIGHFLGLRHTTESDGRYHDLLADTPECSSSYDANGDGEVDYTECAQNGGDNLLFWSGSANVLSPFQIACLQSSPIVVPIR